MLADIVGFQIYARKSNACLDLARLPFDYLYSATVAQISHTATNFSNTILNNMAFIE
jgi:hypothetical protein